MSKYRGPRLRLVRKLGSLPALTGRLGKHKGKRQSTPGQHGTSMKRFIKKQSPYGLRLLEKQKLRFNYNVNERQFVRYIQLAKRSNGPTGELLLGLLEMRLDNIVFQLGMTRTIGGARQLVVHGHILVNQKKVTIPSYSCALKDSISVKPSECSRQLIQRIKKSGRKGSSTPPHLRFNTSTLTGVVQGWADRRWLKQQINELLVVEYYSRN